MRASLCIVLAFALASCGRKVCEPLSARACECAPELPGIEICDSGGTGTWGCVCGPGTAAPDEGTVRVRSTCRRMELIDEKAAPRLSAGGCPAVGELGLDPMDAWGKSIVLVCAPGMEPAVTSSGMDGQFGSHDDLTIDVCRKIEKFGSLAEYDRATRREEEEVALGGGTHAAEDATDTQALIDFLKNKIAEEEAAAAKPRPRPKPKPAPASTSVPTSYTDPISGIQESPKKKHK
jgi:hypothetical protein